MTPTPGRFSCADAARLRGDPPLGTAPYALGWMLIEHNGPWPVDALAGSGIALRVLRELDAAARQAQARILLIRRTGRLADRTSSRSWAMVDVTGRTTWGSWLTDDDLHALAAVARHGGSAESSDDPILLVCTHGIHDTCCAVRGRPVAAVLAKEWPAATWECSHLGGDRFAPNVVVLPDGTYYGYLGAADATMTVRTHLAGTVDMAHLRGLARFPPVAQAAISAAHERHGPWAARDVRADDPQPAGPHRWQVALDSPAGHLTAIVVADRQAPAKLTCRAAAETVATVYRVERLEPSR